LETGAATLAAEIYATEMGADYLRTHDPGALSDALKIMSALRSEAARVFG
jgi:dihydropteroate synthase